MLVGMIAISIVVGFVLTGLLWAAGFGLLSALLWGYVGGGILTMAAMAIRMVVCDRLAARSQSEAEGSSRRQHRRADT